MNIYIYLLMVHLAFSLLNLAPSGLFEYLCYGLRPLDIFHNSFRPLL